MIKLSDSLSDLIAQHSHALGNNPTYGTENLQKTLNQGVTGLDYLLGTKRKSENTFTDEHPVQAVGRDLLNNSLLLSGVGTAGYLGHRGLHDIHNERVLKLLGDQGRNKVPDLREAEKERAFTNSFGQFGLDPEASKKRLDLVKRLSGSTVPSDLEQAFADHQANLDVYKTFAKAADKAQAELNKIDPTLGNTPARQKALSDLASANTLLNEQAGRVAETTSILRELEEGTNAKRYLEAYSHIGKPFGYINQATANEGKNNLPRTHSFKGLPEDPAKLTSERVHLLGKHFKGSMQHHSVPMIPEFGQYIAEQNNLNPKTNPLHARLMHNLSNEEAYNKAKYWRALQRYGKPAAIGLGVGAAGLGLGHVLKKLQEKYYGPEKMKEWQRAALRTKGKFQEAEGI